MVPHMVYIHTYRSPQGKMCSKSTEYEISIETRDQKKGRNSKNSRAPQVYVCQKVCVGGKLLGG